MAQLTTNPVVALNRAVAVSKVDGPQAALDLVDARAGGRALERSHLIPSVRGDLLAQLGRREAARSELETAATLSTNAQERQVLLKKVADL